SMKSATAVIAACVLSFGTAAGQAEDRPVVRIGAKSFTESVILAEILARLAESAGGSAQTLTLGGTAVVWEALLAGEIDAYVDYTGTLRRETLAQELDPDSEDPQVLAQTLCRHGVEIGGSPGFNNTYALAVSRRWAQQHPAVTTISDLRAFPDLRYGL